MRHGKKFNHLGRTSTHRKAMLSNMAASLIINKRITTTVAKAKALRKYVEPLITRSKVDTTQSRRVVFSYLQDKISSQVLFSEVAEKVAERPGGYTRIIKLGSRLGDNAEMALIELVDFNDLYTQGTEVTKAKTRRSRRGGKKKDDAANDTAQAAPVTDTAAVDTAPIDADTTEATAPDTVTEDAVSDDASAEEEHIIVVEEEGNTVKVSGEASLDEPVIIEESAEETQEEQATEDQPRAKSDEEDSSDDDESKDKA